MVRIVVGVGIDKSTSPISWSVPVLTGQRNFPHRAQPVEQNASPIAETNKIRLSMGSPRLRRYSKNDAKGQCQNSGNYSVTESLQIRLSESNAQNGMEFEGVRGDPVLMMKKIEETDAANDHR